MQAGGGHSAAVVTALEEVREVWEWNMRTELPRILEAFDSATCAALDTEFPGFLHQTRPHNLHNLKLIQLGLSFFSDGGRRRTWQISFRDFDVASASDAPSEASVELLKRSDVDLGRTRREGVHSEVLSDCGDAPVGDVPGALRRGVHGEAPHRAAVTADAPRFVQLVGATLGRVVDVKYLARVCGGFYLGLARLAETVGVKLEGCAAHKAGVDALLTESVFEVQIERLCGREEELEGILHAIEEERILAVIGGNRAGGGASPDMPSPPVVYPVPDSCYINRSQDLRFQSKYSRSMLKCSSGDPVLSSVFLKN
ncbi:unnamed protein product [Spirodela intermedia]|uniref:Uncharacterized protein n=1 Tax=Spirodela intermedia TaxID=51605 RepID=A0A7I8KGP3_SPIIN|nr:unnamed protein product [Spirodela intermedia]